MDGRVLDSGEMEANWDAHTPPSDDEIRQKFREQTHAILNKQRATNLENSLWDGHKLPNVEAILALLTPPGEHRC